MELRKYKKRWLAAHHGLIDKRKKATGNSYIQSNHKRTYTMTNDTLQTTILTPEVVKSKLQIALTRVQKTIQNFHDREAMLVYNEDCLKEVKEFIEDIKEAKRLVDAERKRLKEPSLIESRNVDAGAKLVDSQLDEVLAKANVPYQKLCAEVERKRIESEKEKQRVDAIREQMNNFKSTYAVKISDAKTSQELVALERLINLETANKNRYQEFLQEFADDCRAIRSLLADQKIKVRELEELDRKANLAAENGSDEEILQIMEKKELVEAQISEKRVNIQEEALKQATSPTETATVIIPMIPKGGRKLWRYEIVDEKAANKAGFMKLVPNEEKINERLKEIRESETETTENGIRYYIKRKW